MRRIFAAALALLLLTGCSDPDVTGYSERKSVTFYAHNGYFISGYDIHNNENGSYTITVEVEKGGTR